jgi:hypothetical protein
MKNKSTLTFALLFCSTTILMMISGCSKDNTTPTVNPYGANNGQLSFFVVQSSNPRATYPISVSVNNQSLGGISVTYSAAAPPDCGSGTGVLVYTGTAGSYIFTATGANGSSVTGSVNITSGQCLPVTINN